MAVAGPSPGLNPNSVPAVASSHSPHRHEGDEFVNQPKRFKKDEPASQSAEQSDLLHKAIHPIEATEVQPDTIIHQEKRPDKSAPVPAHLIDTHFSLNSPLPSTSPPDAAARITAFTPSTTKIKVKIEPPSLEDCRDDITAYMLQYKEMGSNGNWKTCNIPTTRSAPTTHTIEDLQAATCYIIRVAAANSGGCGPFSPEHECTTLQAPRPPSATPRFTTSSTADAIKVEIEPPPHQSCSDNIKAYRVQHKVVGGNGEWETYDVSSAPNSSTIHVIEHLQPATSYSIRVAAMNSNGCGPFSPEKKCTTHQAPRPPSAAPRFTTSSTADTIRVEIEQTPAETRNELITAYKVQYREGRDGNWETHDDTPSTHTIEGLRPETSFYIRVAAVNSCGLGPFSDNPKECITKRAPTSPANFPRFEAIPRSNSIGITIMAPPPADNVTKYRVQYRMEAGGAEDQYETITTTSRKCRIPDLQPDTSYLVSIAAVNDDGAGPFSEDRQCHTKRKCGKETICTICSGITGVFLLPFIIVLLILIFHNGTLATGEVLYKNGSVLVGEFEPFFQTAVIMKTSATNTNGLSFFRHHCNNLPTANSTIVQLVRKEQLYDTETNVPLYYEYLVDGSTVCFHANITGERNLTDCTAAIYVLDNWHAYSSAFIDGGNITKNISKYCLNVSSIDKPNLPQCFRVPRPGFFFFGAYVPGKDQGLGVELAIIQTVANKVLYNTSALKSACEIPSGEETQHCSVDLFDDSEVVSTSINRKVCILMTVQDESSHIQSLSYSAAPTKIKNFPYKQNLGTFVSLGATAVLTISFFLLVVPCVRRLLLLCRKRVTRYVLRDYEEL